MESRYSAEQLKEMATILVAARRKGDPKYIDFVLSVSHYAGVTPEYVVEKIQEYLED